MSKDKRTLGKLIELKDYKTADLGSISKKNQSFERENIKVSGKYEFPRQIENFCDNLDEAIEKILNS